MMPLPRELHNNADVFGYSLCLSLKTLGELLTIVIVSEQTEEEIECVVFDLQNKLKLELMRLYNRPNRNSTRLELLESKMNGKPLFVFFGRPKTQQRDRQC